MSLFHGHSNKRAGEEAQYLWYYRLKKSDEIQLTDSSLIIHCLLPNKLAVLKHTKTFINIFNAQLLEKFYPEDHWPLSFDGSDLRRHWSSAHACNEKHEINVASIIRQTYADWIIEYVLGPGTFARTTSRLDTFNRLARLYHFEKGNGNYTHNGAEARQIARELRQHILNQLTSLAKSQDKRKQLIRYSFMPLNTPTGERTMIYMLGLGVAQFPLTKACEYDIQERWKQAFRPDLGFKPVEMNSKLLDACRHERVVGIVIATIFLLIELSEVCVNTYESVIRNAKDQSGCSERLEEFIHIPDTPPLCLLREDHLRRRIVHLAIGVSDEQDPNLGFGDAILCEVLGSAIKLSLQCDQHNLSGDLSLTCQDIHEQVKPLLKCKRRLHQQQSLAKDPWQKVVHIALITVLFRFSFRILTWAIWLLLYVGFAAIKLFHSDLQRVMEGGVAGQALAGHYPRVDSADSTTFDMTLRGIMARIGLTNSTHHSQRAGRRTSDCTEPTVKHPYQIMEFALAQDRTPIPIHYTTDMSTVHQISLVDIDIMDMRMEVLVDGVFKGLTRNINPNSFEDCGDDVARCLEGGWSTGTVTIPPGRHEITIRYAGAELDRHGRAAWGKNTTKRFVWWQQTCE